MSASVFRSILSKLACSSEDGQGETLSVVVLCVPINGTINVGNGRRYPRLLLLFEAILAVACHFELFGIRLVLVQWALSLFASALPYLPPCALMSAPFSNSSATTALHTQNEAACIALA
jgi:hypothetical protein